MPVPGPIKTKGLSRADGKRKVPPDRIRTGKEMGVPSISDPCLASMRRLSHPVATPVLSPYGVEYFATEKAIRTRLFTTYTAMQNSMASC